MLVVLVMVLLVVLLHLFVVMFFLLLWLPMRGQTAEGFLVLLLLLLCSTHLSPHLLLKLSPRLHFGLLEHLSVALAVDFALPASIKPCVL